MKTHSQSRALPRPSLLSTIEVLEERRAPAVITVTTASDSPVNGQETLRQAIALSNATTGPNTILFAIGSGSVETITLSSPLPALTQPVSIFGGSQTGTTYTSPGIILNGAGAGSGDGFDVYGGDSTIEGFIIQGFSGNGIVLKTKGGDEIINDAIGTNASLNAKTANTMDGVLVNGVGGNAIQSCVISGNTLNGIELTGAGASNNLIGAGNTAANANSLTSSGGGNFIGMDITGAIAVPNLLDGVLIHGSAPDNSLVGNVISANGGNGVHITGIGSGAAGTGTTGNSLIQNYIGTDVTGILKFANKGDGILIDGGANTNMVGDGTAADANVISGNTGNGIHLNGAGTLGNTVACNNIGVDVSGLNALGNGGAGVLIDGGASGNTIGSDSSTNVISANAVGVHITGTGLVSAGAGTTGNIVIGNFIGVDTNGTGALGNTGAGIVIDGGANENSIGDGSGGGQNLISCNGGGGVIINGSSLSGSSIHAGTAMNSVVGNLIGTDIRGSTALGNTGDGVLIENGACGNTIGATSTVNVISANGTGVHITGAATKDNTLLGNYIGADSSGMSPLGNTGNGILIDGGSSGNQIGSDTAGGGNVVSANGANGIYIAGTGAGAAGSGTTGNVLLGNFIGVGIDGASALPNTDEGVLIDNGANANKIGDGTGAGANVISGNGGDGIHINGSSLTVSKGQVGTANNVILGDFIGVDISGSMSVGNTGAGVLIDNGASANTVGSTGSVNVISANATGVHITGTGTAGNILLGNYIGTDSSGTAALGNTGNGILIDAGASGTQIGSDTAGGGNLVSANGASGIYISGSGAGAAGTGTTGTVLLANTIGTDITSATALSNTGAGVLIDNGANATKIGDGSKAGANVISGNGGAGIDIDGSSLTIPKGDVGTANISIFGDFIGTDITGTVVVGNSGDGVLIDHGAGAITIGSTTSHNIISGNLNGIHVSGTGAGAAGTGATGITILGNYIGTDITGTLAGGNTDDGILIDNGANTNSIGNGSAAGANVISANDGSGIEINGSALTPGSNQVGTSHNTIEGNFIGTDVTGTQVLGNTGDGVLITNGASDNTVGSTGSHNVISNNANGIHISGTGAGAAGTGTTGNSVLGNYIGTDITGTASLGNNDDGILIDNGANGNSIGNGSAGGENIVSANGSANNNPGIEIDGSSLTLLAGQAGTANNTVVENLIGTDITGKQALGNYGDGILIDNGASDNTIGSATTHNVISFNANGVHISGAGSDGNLLLANYIGVDVTGAAAAGNNGDGVLIDTGASDNTIGAAGSHNIISGNTANGVHITGTGAGAAGTGTTGNVVIANYIGTDLTGKLALGNSSEGILIDNGANATQIGNGAAAGSNVISANQGDGVHIDGGNLTLTSGQVGTANNSVLDNYIGTNLTGSAALANGNDGVLIDNGATGNTIGAAASHNVISGNTNHGVEIAGAGTTGNSVLGNMIGADATGKIAIGNGGNGVMIDNGASSNTIGGTASGSANVISANASCGVQIDGSASTGNSVLGNYIGTDAAGTAALANSSDGVQISNGSGANAIGNGTSGAGNFIAANGGDGVDISSGSGNFIQGNNIGVGVGGKALGNTGDGVFVNGNNNLTGGETSGAGNVIQNNGGNGVNIEGGNGNGIQQNSIYSNSAFGISLSDGVNNNAPAPAVTVADYMGTGLGTNVSFTFNGAANTTYQIELFDSPTANASGYGEGKTSLTPTPISVTTNASGVAINPADNTAVFTLTGLAGALPGSVISATATDPGLNTSGFAQDLSVISAPPVVNNVIFATNTKNKVTGVEIEFSVPLAAATVNAMSIGLFSAGSRHTYMTPIKLAKTDPISYDAADSTVTITPKSAIPANDFIRVFVNGTTDPVMSATGTALDGEFTTTLPSGDGAPGGDFDALISHGSHLTYKDTLTNSVSLTLAKGGFMELIEPLGGAPAYLELAKVVSARSTLTGSVKKGHTGTGVTALEGLIGLDGALDKLSALEFTIGSTTELPG